MVNILFDCEIMDAKPSLTLTGEVIFEDIREYVKKRLNVLNDEINRYSDGVICINIFQTMKEFNPNMPFGICSVNFPLDLQMKIQQCFDEKTLEFLELKLLGIRNSFGN